MDSLRIRGSTFWTQKKGNKPDEYEDAFAPRFPDTSWNKDIPSTGTSNHSFSIADGASEGFLSKRWAEVLVDFFQPGEEIKNADDFGKCLVPVYGEWRKRKAEYLADRAQNNPLKWFEEQGIANGGYSSVLAVRFAHDLKWRYQAVAVGDSCLFHIRQRKPIKAFPIERSELFDSRPRLLSSESFDRDALCRSLHVDTSYANHFKPGDCLYLMTDALSAWFLREIEAHRNPVDTIKTLRSQDQFSEFVNDLRKEGSLGNDDTTLMVIERTGRVSE